MRNENNALALRVAPVAHAGALGLAACGGSKPASRPAGEGAPGTATAKLKNADGSTFTIAELDGKAKVMNVWATWCAPCIGEMPLLNEMAKKYEPQGVTFVAVSIDENGPADVDPVLAGGKLKIDFRKAFAQIDDIKPLNVDVPIPDTLVFDGSNRLVAHFDKVVEREELEAAIAKALEAS
jgi:thiol-disulfide isomerase/thioredoxin